MMDIVTSMVALYLSVWVYETLNWVSLTVAGAKATILVARALRVAQNIDSIAMIIVLAAGDAGRCCLASGGSPN
jgi:hypothetical protein